jgi:hypothetical protein
VLQTASRQLYIQPSYVFGCLRGGAKYTSRKRGTLQPYVAATLQVIEDRILIDRWVHRTGPVLESWDDPVYLDRRCVVNPGTGKRNDGIEPPTPSFSGLRFLGRPGVD